MPKRDKRPVMLSTLAIFVFLIGILCLVEGTLFAMGKVEPPESLAWGTKEETGLICMGIGAACVAMAGGFWDGWKFAWYIGMIVMIALGISQLIVSIMYDPWSFIGVILSVLIVFYLLRPSVKTYFRHRS